MHPICLKDKTLDLSTPSIMGILNVTPDSFYDGGKNGSGEEMLKNVNTMIQEGADIIDIGAVSTRPGAADVSRDIEKKRVIPALELIKHEFPDILISIDTWRSSIASTCIEKGADIINDISGGSFDEEILEVVRHNNTPFIMMHIQGRPDNMQKNPHYDDIIGEISAFFDRQLSKLDGYKNVILDPGIGFGKSLDHNYEILRKLRSFSKYSLPMLVGLSRKSLINMVLKTKPEQALNGTSVLNTIALLNGANILRVHDVKEAVEVKKLVLQYLKETE